VDAREEALHGRLEAWRGDGRGIVCARGPGGGVGEAVEGLGGQDEPGVLQVRVVDEAEDVGEQAEVEDDVVAQAFDEVAREEEEGHLCDAHHGQAHAKERRRRVQLVRQVHKQERRDLAHEDAHEEHDEEERDDLGPAQEAAHGREHRRRLLARAPPLKGQPVEGVQRARHRAHLHDKVGAVVLGGRHGKAHQQRRDAPADGAPQALLAVVGAPALQVLQRGEVEQGRDAGVDKVGDPALHVGRSVRRVNVRACARRTGRQSPWSRTRAPR